MQDVSCVCDLHHSSRQCWILKPLSEAGIKPTTSWFLVRFISSAPQRELLFLVFWGISIVFTVAAPVQIPTNSGAHFSTPSPAFIICRLFDDDHSSWCKVVSHSGFDLHFSNNEWCWTSFHVVFGPSVCLLWRIVCLDLLPIFFFFLVLLGLLQRHMEVPGLGVQSEL